MDGIPLEVWRWLEEEGHGITPGELLLKHAERTLHHKPLSAMEGQRVELMDLGTLDQLWTQMARKAETIDVDGYLEEQTSHAIL